MRARQQCCTISSTTPTHHVIDEYEVQGCVLRVPIVALCIRSDTHMPTGGTAASKAKNFIGTCDERFKIPIHHFSQSDALDDVQKMQVDERMHLFAISR